MADFNKSKMTELNDFLLKYKGKKYQTLSNMVFKIEGGGVYSDGEIYVDCGLGFGTQVTLKGAVNNIETGQWVPHKEPDALDPYARQRATINVIVYDEPKSVIESLAELESLAERLEDKINDLENKVDDLERWVGK